jgi:ADP-ribose pyrophosphatase
MTRQVKPGRVQASDVTYSDRWLTLRSDPCVTAEGQHIAPYHVIEYPNWINVVALTKLDGRLILTGGYRHGRREIFLGLVSGAVEVNDGTDDASTDEPAARRELREETGFGEGQFIKVLGSYPNTANHSNRVTSFIAFDVQGADTRSLDTTEVIHVVIDDLDAVLIRLRDGEMEMQAMHVAALWSAAARILTYGDLPESAISLQRRLRSLLI